MAIDWAATGTWMQAWAGFAQAAAIGFAAWKAADTFRSWRKQKIEERRIVEAERILTLAYKIRMALSGIRNPLMSGLELENAKASLTKDNPNFETLPENQRKKFAYQQAVYNRISLHSADWNDLVSIIPTSLALFGVEIELQLDVLWGQPRLVHNAADIYAMEHLDDLELLEDAKADLWGGNIYGRDRIGESVEAAIKLLECQLLPIIRGGQ